MAVPHDIDSKQIPEKIATQVGCAAMLTSSAKDLQEVFDAYLAEKQRADEAEARAEAEKQRADKAEQEIEYWKRLAQRPKIVFRDNSSLGKLVTGDSNEIYAEDNSIQRQQSPRQLGAGKLECV